MYLKSGTYLTLVKVNDTIEPSVCLASTGMSPTDFAHANLPSATLNLSSHGRTLIRRDASLVAWAEQPESTGTLTTGCTDFCMLISLRADKAMARASVAFDTKANCVLLRPSHRMVRPEWYRRTGGGGRQLKCRDWIIERSELESAGVILEHQSELPRCVPRLASNQRVLDRKSQTATGLRSKEMASSNGEICR